MPKARIVTPADQNSPSIRAFRDELENTLGWGNITQVYSPTGYGGSLDGAAQAAVTAYVAGDVIITAGVDATAKVQAKNPGANIPIVLALGGYGNNPPNAAANLTGFYIDTVNTAKFQAGQLHTALPNGTVTILCDYSNNSVSKDAYDAVAPMFAPAKLTKLDKTAAALQPLPAKSVTTDSFLVIPNAGYYANIHDVIKLVDGNNVKVYYPERDYKHKHQKKTDVFVHGHKVSITFRLAAYYADNILSGIWAVGSLPALQEAMTDSF